MSTLESLLGQPVTLGRAVAGGDIAQPRQGMLQDGQPVFVKSGQGLPAGMLPAEAIGLKALARGGCRIPEVLAVDGDWLVLEWIERGRSTDATQAALGRGLAAQHQVCAESSGFEGDNFIGRTPQENPPTEDWVVFFRDHRLGAMQRMLWESGRLSVADDAALEKLRRGLHRWLALPEEAPVLLHGDLWGGNAMAGPDGEPVLFDPAAYYGCRETDLAMTRLFGGFSRAFYRAYEEVLPLSPGFEERVKLYNLYHLLNHALMFGGGYLDQSMAVVYRYAG